MARDKAPDHEQQRQRIMRNAIEAFARTGYASASLSELASACEVSKATLYHYFASKDAILFEALDGYTKRLSALVSAARSAPAKDAKATLDLVILKLTQDYVSARPYQVSLLIDVKFLPEGQRNQIRKQERLVVEDIAQAIELAYPKALGTRDRKATVMSLLGMLNFSFAWYRPDGELTPDDFSRLVSGLWHKALDEGQPRPSSRASE